MKLLPLYPGAHPCVQCGYCCTVAPCPFGTWDPERKQCRELQWTPDGRSRCGIIEQIVEQPGWEISPAFGAGCCSPFNTLRRILVAEAPEKGPDHKV